MEILPILLLISHSQNKKTNSRPIWSKLFYAYELSSSKKKEKEKKNKRKKKKKKKINSTDRSTQPGQNRSYQFLGNSSYRNLKAYTLVSTTSYGETASNHDLLCVEVEAEVSLIACKNWSSIPPLSPSSLRTISRDIFTDISSFDPPILLLPPSLQISCRVRHSNKISGDLFRRSFDSNRKENSKRTQQLAVSNTFHTLALYAPPFLSSHVPRKPF